MIPKTRRLRWKDLEFKVILSYVRSLKRAGEMAQEAKVPATKLNGLSSVPGAHMVEGENGLPKMPSPQHNKREGRIGEQLGLHGGTL